MAADDTESADRLNRFLDGLAEGTDRSPNGQLAPDHELAPTVRQLRAYDDAPIADPRFADRLQEDLMHATPHHDPLALDLTPALPRVHVGRAAARAQPRLDIARPRWVLAQLATAALLVLSVIASFFTFGPGRPRPEHLAPAIFPAITGTPATTQGVTAPLAEVLWQADGGPDFPFERPTGLAIDPAGNVWVADGDNSRFVIFSPDGDVLEAWGTAGSGEGEFEFDCSAGPAKGLGFGAVAFDAAGNIYVADAGNERIQKFGLDRTFLTSWATAGPANEPFGCPGSIAVDRQGRVYVGGEHWGRVEVFDDEGDWLATWPDLNTPVGITVDEDGNIWIADSAGEVVQFSADGERLSTWKGDVGYIEANGVAVDAQGRVFATDFAHRVVVFAPDGTVLGEWGERGDAPGEFRTPWGIALDGQGAVYISDPYGQRIQKFQLLPPLGPSAPAA